MEKERGIKITNVDKKKQCDIHVVVRQSEQLVDKNFDCFEYSQGFHRCFEQCKKCKSFNK